MAGHMEEGTSFLDLGQAVDLAPAHLQQCHLMDAATDFSYLMQDDAYKARMQLGANALYHLDTNNRRIWVPESCTIHHERNSRSPSGTKSITTEESILMAAQLENELLQQQHAVSIERFPNRCYRGPNSGRTQYEKGAINYI